LNSTYRSDCTTNKYLFFSSTSTVPSYVCTTITSSTTLCTGGLILYYDATNFLYSCQTNAYIVGQCGSTTVPYAIETAMNSNDLINVFTCVTATAMSTKCSTALYPLIFFHTDSTFYCRSQGQITPYCSNGVLRATKTISSNSFNFYRCVTNS
jgi:hypothetical protein